VEARLREVRAGGCTVKVAFVAIVGSAMLVFAGVAASASSYADAEGDANTPADITSVAVSAVSSAVIAVTVDVANYRTLPPNSSLGIWFDVDGNPETGNGEGREARVLFPSTGDIGLQLWSGTRLVDQSPTGITGSFSDGRLTLSVPRATLGMAGAFGVYVVSSRAQPAAAGDFVAYDAAPESGNLVFRGSEPSKFVDLAGDHESAPDIASVQVTEAEDGWISFAISIPNSALLPRTPVVGLSIDTDDDPRTGDSGADLGVTALGANVVADRWNERSRTWVPYLEAPRVRAEIVERSVVIDVHRSELGAGRRFGFAALAAGLAADDSFTGVDVTPDGARFFRYQLKNATQVRLVAGKVRTAPAKPRRGARLTVTTKITRSDTGVSARTGSVTCAVKVNGKRVAATGRYASGRASCTFRVPKKARRIVGSMRVRGDGVSSTVPFSYRLG
jgi:hypothetical protein